MRTLLIRSRIAAPLLACLIAGAVAAAPSTTKITYLAGAMVYVDVGSLDGVQPGDTVQVLHAGTPVAMAKVAFVSTRRAACDTLWTRGRILIGDDLVYTAHAVAPPPTGVPGTPGAPTRQQGIALAAAKAHRPRLRGRVGARWLSVNTGAPGQPSSGFQQPAIDFRFDGIDQGGGHLDLSVDVRNRRTVRTFNGASTTEQISRVYRASMVVRSLDSHQQFSIGRQTSAALSSVSMFDGVLAQSGTDRHSYGLFSGTQPDPLTFGVADSVFESGAFYEFHSLPTSERRYQVSMGGIMSRDHGKVNRDFLFGLANWSNTKFMSTLTQEVDINTGWKRVAGEQVLSPTSTFWMVRLTPVRWWGFDTGIDNRRNVRLWRDRITPADQFDDAYRQGMWFGSDVNVLNRLRFSGETRGAAGADHSSSWTGGAEAYRLTRVHASLRGRMSQFTSSNVTSRLWSASLGLDPTTLSHLEASGGVRGTRVAPAATWDNQNWSSVELDLTLGRRWYANGGYERDYGGTSGNTEMVQGGLSWRF